jgi:DNA polymerase I
MIVEASVIERMFNLVASAPHSVEVIVGPLEKDQWLALPQWVRLRVMPDGYDVVERVSPLVQELIWSGRPLSRAKSWEKKPPKKEALLTQYNEAKVRVTYEWPKYWERSVEVFTPPGIGELVALDFETDGKFKKFAKTTGLAAFSQSGGSQFIGHHLEDGYLQRQRDAWEDGQVGVPIFHNAQFDIAIAQSHGWSVPQVWHDTQLMAFASGEKYRDDRKMIGLKVLASKYLGIEMIELDDFIPKAELKRNGTLNADPILLAEYAKADAKCTYQLYDVFKDHKKFNQRTYDLEREVTPVTIDMELGGIGVDEERLEKIRLYAEIGKLNIEKWFVENCEWDGNLNSPEQVSQLMYDKLGLKTQYGRSTSKEAMELLNWHPVAKRVRAWRKLDSLSSDARDMVACTHGGVLYTGFNQTGASTGRFSSSDPINMQNKVELLRSACKPHEEGHVFYTADYGQIELRIVAAMSSDRNMWKAINAGESMHRNLHRMLREFGIDIPYHAVKTFDFSLFYGADVPRVMEVVGCSRDKAEKIIDAVERLWEEAMVWRKLVVNQAVDNMGWNETLMGRPLYHPGLLSPDFKEFQDARRAAINKPIQGTGADILKMAMCTIPSLHRKYGGRMRITLHDEVAGTIPIEAQQAFKKDLEELMIGVEERVPLSVEIGFGENWMMAKRNAK